MNFHYRALLLFAVCILNLTAFSQTNQVISVGNIASVNISEQRVDFRAEHAYGQIVVYNASVMRVRIDRKELGADFSYSVIGEPEKTRVAISQNDQQIIIETDSIKAIIAKKPYRITFQNKSGQVISEDESGLTTSWVGDEVTTYKKMQSGERFIGLGEKTGNLDRAGNGYTNWNTDNFGYSTGADPLYATIPFYIGIHNNLNYGIFLDNTYQTDFNFGASNNRFSSFAARGGEMNYYFLYNSTVAGLIRSYTALTGRMKLPPLWSLGYQQNRYSYYPETEVMRIAQTLREKKIPADGITLDIHYMDNYKLFTWNNDRFPDPRQMNQKLAALGFKTTVIVDPGIKVENGYQAYESGLKQNIFIKYPDSTNYTAQVWPGWCHFPDFTAPKGREWWKDQLKFFTNTGVSGIWNDMNEIASWGQKMPSNVLFNYDGKIATNQQAHNIYGFQMARASYEGMVENKKERPFNLTRAGFAGLQRYTAIWTGDNRSEDDHMLAGVRLLNSLGLSGVAFAGMDIGGFTGNPSVGLYARWIQLGAFNPYFRNHTAVNTKSSEPWSFGEEVLEISRNFIGLRYRLLPYLYSTFFEATQNGLPVMRSLAIDNTFDASVYDPQFQNQFGFGKSFLIMPFESTSKFGKVYFPKGNWYNFFSDEIQQGNSEKIISVEYNRLPVYVRESSIVPMQSLIQSTVEKPTDTLTIHVYKGNVNNSFLYYEDDGKSFSYQDGNFYKRNIVYDGIKRSIILEKPEGNFSSHFKNLKLVLHGFSTADKLKSGAKVKDEFFSVLEPISKFDPQGNSNNKDQIPVKSIDLKNSAERIVITY